MQREESLVANGIRERRPMYSFRSLGLLLVVVKVVLTLEHTS